MLDEPDRKDREEAARAEATPATPLGEGGRLKGALRKARLAEAERSDVVLELREAERARLELLHDALEDVVADIPPGTDLLECALVPGSPPRLWIDVLAYVAMGRDRRTYRFIKETRYGPSVILESASVDDMAAAVTDYIAHRLLERARALDSDTHAQSAPSATRPVAEGPQVRGEPPSTHGGMSAGNFILTLLLGALLGAGALFGYAYYLALAG